MIWRKTKEFENISVSDDGQVRNDHTGHIYKPTLNQQGYTVITGPDRKQYKIHRLVARAFQDICGTYGDDLVVDHINTIKTDNRVCNLRWVTIGENANNPITRQKQSDRMKGDLNPMKNEDVAHRVALHKKGSHISDEHKTSISNKLKGRIMSDVTRMKISMFSRRRHRNTKGQFLLCVHLMKMTTS